MNSNFQQKFQEYQNGRVVIPSNEHFKPYELYTGQSAPSKCIDPSLQTVLVRDELNQTFFSKENIDLLQEMIKKDIFDRSNGEYQIGRQSDHELQIIMRSVYLQYAKHLPNMIKEQVLDLNRLVIQECVQKIYPRIQQYLYYRKDISQMPQTLFHPQNVSSAGTKTLYSKIGFGPQ